VIEVLKQKIKWNKGNKCLSIIISSFNPCNLLIPLGSSLERIMLNLNFVDQVLNPFYALEAIGNLIRVEKDGYGKEKVC